ncbi:hypothetical protein TPHA_0J01250 [Tetrapisispora phaffii CBS 4417]|uniref:Sphingoid long-chain base transporter RSB1 n=1 Tax=Tetrapisispora phaffii (strain ATCC 24235 / CBS 4417 / NBRC 1672 / NRRL Y-8282 / UCD 70-5) TaxID=1071381 RepID=G8BYK5_TETPH|nr:hypothetical protein TPHA_0J01250 [Tetrapisispora phaffii CBS 4417]CCE64947.1 hypothetical protein TPHA_0J01250 [Tetrapisispora phaffii CBS 4417]
MSFNQTAIAAIALLQKKDKISDGESFYSGLVPNLRFNGAMIAIWSILLGTHVFMLYLKQWWFSSAYICASILELLGYIGRTWSHFNVYSENGYLLQFICLTIAPVFTMGGMYYQLAKLIEIYGHRFSLLPSPMIYSYFFILCDIVSLVVQAAGGGVAGVAVNQHMSTQHGTNIFVAGLALQVATLSIFIILLCHFFYVVYVKTRMEYANASRPSFKLLKLSQAEIEPLYRAKFHDLRKGTERWQFNYFSLAFTVAVLCVFTRCCYRLAELAQGFRGYIITHEWYFIPLDGIMISLCTTIMAVFHPGFAFLGRTYHIPITSGKTDPEGRHDEETNSSASNLNEDLEEKEDDSDSNRNIFQGVVHNVTHPNLHINMHVPDKVHLNKNYFLLVVRNNENQMSKSKNKNSTCEMMNKNT